MKKINVNDIKEDEWKSPRGTFVGAGRQVSISLGRDALSTDLMKRHPFDVEILRIPPGQKPYPYHSHSAQWEFYHMISGKGLARDEGGTTPVVAGDAFIYEPGQAHQLVNDGSEDLLVYVIADNPVGESCHYPDSNKWVVRSPERRLMRGEPLDYFDGEE
jgi:uncharacterized cupin superfamily protein